MSGMSVSQFLGHSGSGSRGNFLKSWKDKGFIDVFLHTRAPILALWRHPIPKIQIREDKDTKRTYREVWGGEYGCWEDEKTLKEQYKRDRETGAREFPPMRCGICKMTEFIRDCVEGNTLSWVEPVFEFKGDDPKKTRIIHAGGLFGAFKGDLPDEKKHELYQHSISLKTAYQEKIVASLKYGFAVADASDVSGGVQLTTESQLCGDRTKEAIRKQIKSKGEEEGDPSLNPYCIRWEYNEKETNFQKKYDATVIDRIVATPSILELLRSSPPSMEHMAEKFNAKTMRALLEEHCLIDLPWDEFFPPGQELFAPDKEESKQDRATRAPEVNTKNNEEPLIPCDNCKAMMRPNDPKCAKCGQEYLVDEETKPAPEPEPPPPPPPPTAPRRRGNPVTAKAADAPTSAPKEETPAKAAPAPATGQKKTITRPTSRAAAFPDSPGNDDDIPF